MCAVNDGDIECMLMANQPASQLESKRNVRKVIAIPYHVLTSTSDLLAQHILLNRTEIATVSVEFYFHMVETKQLTRRIITSKWASQNECYKIQREQYFLLLWINFGSIARLVVSYQQNKICLLTPDNFIFFSILRPFILFWSFFFGHKRSFMQYLPLSLHHTCSYH